MLPFLSICGNGSLGLTSSTLKVNRQLFNENWGQINCKTQINFHIMMKYPKMKIYYGFEIPTFSSQAKPICITVMVSFSIQIHEILQCSQSFANWFSSSGSVCPSPKVYLHQSQGVLTKKTYYIFVCLVLLSL